MKINAYAKINLMLDVIKKRDDGFHDVKMIMQTLELCDVITAEKTESGIYLSGSDLSLDYGESNLAHKAAALFFKISDINGGAKIHIEKNIPICAGMAGGSSDAAAVLIALNELYGYPLAEDVLIKESALLGSDVPYCIMKGTALAEGRGEILTKIADFYADNILIVKPDIGISTPWAYKSLKLNEINHPDVDKAIIYIEENDNKNLYCAFENVFEYINECNLKSLLDIGAGTGAATWAISNFIDFENITCLEKEKNMMAFGKNLMLENKLERNNNLERTKCSRIKTNRKSRFYSCIIYAK